MGREKSLYCPILSAILGNKLGNTADPVLAMGENRGGYGGKDCFFKVKGLLAMGVRP